MRYIAIIVCGLLCGSVRADGWQVAANAGIVADCLQTHYIANHPRYHEGGWAETFIGEHPSSGDVTRWCVLSLATTNIVGELILPEKWRKWFYIGITTIQAQTVYENAQIGIHFDIP
jgi:hypothetical protein